MGQLTGHMLAGVTVKIEFSLIYDLINLSKTCQKLKKTLAEIEPGPLDYNLNVLLERPQIFLC